MGVFCCLNMYYIYSVTRYLWTTQGVFVKTEFSATLLRLKEALGVHDDKQVAEVLGMADRAFAARKARGSFPDDKLYALAARRPDLTIDAAYVLTGERKAEPVPVSATLSEAGDRVDADRLAACMKLVIDRADQRRIKLDSVSVARLTGGLHDYMGKGFPLDAEVVDLALDAFMGGRGG